MLSLNLFIIKKWQQNRLKKKEMKPNKFYCFFFTLLSFPKWCKFNLIFAQVTDLVLIG